MPHIAKYSHCGGYHTGDATGRSARLLRSAFQAIFNMTVEFKYVFIAPDGIIGNIRFNNHGHKDSISGDIDKQKEI